MTKLEELVLEWQEATRQDHEAITEAEVDNAYTRLMAAREALMAYKVPTGTEKRVRGNQ